MKVWVSLSPRVMPTMCLPPSSPLTSRPTSVPNGGAPTTTAVPRAARLSTDWRSTCTLPVVSMTPSQPAPPVISAIRAGKSSVEASTTWVAPSLRARSSRWGTTSTATIRWAGVSAAAITAERPTAPAPATTTVLPGPGLSTFHTAPTPVCTPQPSGAMRLQRCGRVDLDHAALVGDGQAGERRLAEEVAAERLAAAGDGGRPVPAGAADQVVRQPGGAVGRVPAAAVAAAAARGERQQHVVAGRHRGDGRADPLDDAGALVAEHAGQREGQSARGHAEVGVAQAGGGHPDQDLVGAGLVELDLDQGEGGAAGLDDGGLGGDGHGCSSDSGWGRETTTDLTLV